jgi:DNA-binding CsgD family transcriptional regulator
VKRETAFPELSPGLLARVDAVRERRPPGVGQHGAGMVPQQAELTVRELEVLDLVAAGDSNDEIAEKLYIGRQTVMSHVKHLFFKLGARNRAHAVACGFRSGLL